MVTELGFYNDLNALQRIISPKGLKVVDIGCGDGKFAESILALGAHRVTGIEPDQTQAARNREADLVSGLELIEAGAQSLPLENASQDLVIFRFSLHHIPASLYPEVFREVARVLKPGATLYVIEPLLEGSSQYVMELFHDETEVRKAAQQALRVLNPTDFQALSTYRYEVRREYANFSAYCKRYGNLSYNDYAMAQVNDQRVQNRFEEFADANGQITLIQPVRADLFTRS